MTNPIDGRWPMGYLLDFLSSARTLNDLQELGISICPEACGSELTNRRAYGF